MNSSSVLGARQRDPGHLSALASVTGNAATFLFRRRQTYPGEAVSGDAARVIERQGHLLAMVSDGLGHGERAHDASAMATAWVDAHPVG